VEAKDRRLAQLAGGLRPVFWAVQVAMPRQAARLEKAVERCSRLAYSQEIRRLEREEVRRAYLDWRRAFLDKPQAAARAMYEKGIAALSAMGRSEAVVLRKWVGREAEIVRAVYAGARGTETPLPTDEYQAAVRAGQIGRLLKREQEAPSVELPADFPEKAALDRLSRRLHAFDIRSPLSPDRLGAVAPSEIADSLRTFKSVGLLDDGAGWTLRAGAARSLARELDRVVDRAVEADQLLTDALLKRRQAP
jgi:hypothetical protein